MKKDLPENIVQDVAIVVVLEEESSTNRTWTVYLVNLKDKDIETVLVSSRGYGHLNGQNVKTSLLRHSIGKVPAGDFAMIELIDEQVFGLNNEYWLSYYQDDVLYDKKFIFVPDSIVDENLIKIPIINKPGVMIK
ncbi:hypothetical protein [Solitalea koreensis]|uniref:Uncharacterized protein n=1 Tax=Solitalea koreensis TaxID=543615 RepID=A0A521BR64_9SPHI|nr:hypothetical protein [Solitalea koreensis]SMO49646.1 hypothetical protein SAMN06265350_102481 [Solitalea koreensis]